MWWNGYEAYLQRQTRLGCSRSDSSFPGSKRGRGYGGSSSIRADDPRLTVFDPTQGQETGLTRWTGPDRDRDVVRSDLTVFVRDFVLDVIRALVASASDVQDNLNREVEIGHPATLSVLRTPLRTVSIPDFGGSTTWMVGGRVGEHVSLFAEAW